ncbi:MAG: hypothetical protein KC996_07640 [Phycisphaerales bacterium]|nr:hypothetical protein [Phycisphaerales bacterium]
MTKPIHLTIVALLLSVLSPFAIAQDAMGPAEQCIARVRAITHHTAEHNAETAERTIAAVRSLDDDGASNAAIIAAGQTGKGVIDDRSEHAANRVHVLVHECVEQLRADGAPIRVVMAVIEAGQNARERIGDSAQRTKLRITHAVQIAIN